MFQKYIGDRHFYRRALSVSVPIIIQNGITNFVSLLDNIMVGRVGTLPMSGVSIINQLLMVFNLCIFGASSGAGIFTAQFYGSGNDEGVKHTFRFKNIMCMVLAVGCILLFHFQGRGLAGLYLTGEGSPEDAADALQYGIEYLNIMLLGLIPFAISNSYSSTLRETGETMVPMIAGITAVFVNLIFNYILIFGHFGAPAMGVQGAAWATVISRFVELILVAGWTHLHSEKAGFIVGAYASLYIPISLVKVLMVKGMPLLVNEFLWSSGMALLNQCYSTCGLDVVPAMNIATTLSNLGSVVFLSLGSSIGIIMGQMLGASRPEKEVRDENRKLIALAVASGLVCALLVISVSRVFPAIYVTTDSVRELASELIVISALYMPIHAFLNPCYFTLRSGGQALITFLYDSGYTWAVLIPLALLLTHFTNMGILPLYVCVQLPDILKVGLGKYMLKKGTWIRNLTA